MIRAALRVIPDLGYSISATTRKPRGGEVDGREYIFLDRETFERWVEEGEFLEWAEYSGNLYGTPERKVEEFLAAGRSVILEIELQGARLVRKERPDAQMIFVRAPSLEETRKRLESRKTETGESVETRMATAELEVAAKTEFDHEIINADRERAAEEIIALMRRIIG